MLAWRKVLCTLVVVVGLALSPTQTLAQRATNPFPTYLSDRTVFQIAPGPLVGAITVMSRFDFPSDEQLRNVDTIWLAGFTSDKAASPTALAVRFRRDGWFQLWTLGLDTNLDLIPPDLRPTAGTGEWTGYQMLTLEGSKFPEPGHTYQTTVSYLPSTGYLAIAVVDVTTGETFYRRTLQLKPWYQPLYAGTATQHRAVAAQHDFDLIPQLLDVGSELVPVGVAWRLMEQSPSGSWLPVTRVDRRNELRVEIDTGTELPLPGQLRLMWSDPAAGAEDILATVAEPAGVIRLPIAGARLPAGTLKLQLEYVHDNKVAIVDERGIDVGLVQAKAAPVRVDSAAQVVEGALIVEADGALDEVTLQGEVVAEARSLVTRETNVYRSDLAQTIAFTEAETRAIPFRFPLPPSPTRWTMQVKADIAAQPGVRVRVEVPSLMRTVTAIEKDAQELLWRIREQYIQAMLLPGPRALELPALAEEGSWADIDYSDQSVGGWQAVQHLERTLLMARAYATPGGPYHDSEDLLQQITSALSYWTANRFRNPNWWFNVIWQPQRLGDILLLVGDALPWELYTEALQLIEDEVLSRPASHYTGANLVWNEGNRLRLGLVTGDLDVVALAFEMMTSELRVVSFGQEGIQVDGSFHQHGSMLYSGGYGESFAGDLARFAYVARGTELFPSEALEVLVSFILDGQQWMVRGNTLDYSTTGRVLSREQKSGNAYYLIGMVQTLLSLPEVPRRDELQAFLDRMLGSGEPLHGNRYFWTSDFMVHHRPDYYVSVKASSSRTMATEIGNYENLKGHHLGDGMMFIMRTGKEYDQTFPLWNWEMLPGTTVRHMDHQLLLDGSWLTVQGAGNPAGGVSDGVYGALAMNLDRDGIRAKKAWFFFDREVVALGTDIEGIPQATVTTGINQARLTGDVTVGTVQGEQLLPPDVQVQLDDVTWVHHDGVAYVFPEPAAVYLANAVRTGRWSDINTAYSNEEISLPLFSLWIDHSGDGPKEYTYLVAPGIERDAVAEYVAGHGVQVIANTSRVQAVWHEQLRQLQAVFWEAAAVTTPAGVTVSVDGPVLILVKGQDDGYEVTAGSLERKPGDVSVRIAGDTGTGAKAQFTFPAGDTLGRSVTQKL